MFLQSLRDNSKGYIAYFIVGLLVVVFALSGADALFSGSVGGNTVLSINGQKLSELDIARAIDQQKQQLRSRFGSAIPEDFLSNENLREPAIKSLTERTLIGQAAEKAGMTVSDAGLDGIIRADPSFHGVDGKIDAGLYRQSLARVGYTPVSYKRTLLEGMVSRQLVSGITRSSFITANELDYLVDLSYQARDFNYVTLNADELLKSVEISSEAIQVYYAANSEQFTHPEMVTVEFIELGVNNLSESIDIADEALQAQYDENIAAFVASTERGVAHILIEAEQAENIALVQAQLDKGADFNELAKQYSDDLGSKDAGGELGISTGSDFPEAFEAALASLSVGEVSGAIETDAGTHFIKLLSINDLVAPTFEEQKDSITRMLKRNTAETQFVEILDRLTDLSYNAESLAVVADELGLTLGKSEPFSRTGGIGIARNGAVVTAAFSQDVLVDKNASEIIELAPDRVLVVKVIDHKQSFIKALEEVNEEITGTLKEQEAAQQLTAQGAEIEAALASGTPFGQLATERNLELKEIKNVGRSALETPKAILDFAFTIAKPVNDKMNVAGLPQPNSYTIVELLRVHSSTNVSEDQKREAARSMEGLLGSVDFSSYQAHLLVEAKIEDK